MLKSKVWFVGVLVVIASGLPPAPAQASELVKLGKLLVTGKRTPSAEARPVAEKPAPRAELAAPATPAAERQGAGQTAAAGRVADAPSSGDAHTGYEWVERQAENRQPAPASEGAPRGAAPAPQPGGAAADMEAAF